MSRTVLSRVVLTGLGMALASTAVLVPPAAAATKAQTLVGTFRLTAGAVTASGVTGSYFRMIYPGGTVAGGKFFDNPDSKDPDKSYTPVSPGTAGGLVTGKYQAAPSPAFDSTGNSLAGAIIAPQTFTAIDFGLATDPKDPSTGVTVPPPSIQVKGGKLSGQVRAFTAAWNNLYFNQGSPKPDGSKPGLTATVSGTYNPKTHAFVLTWSSQVVGGPFNGFTGYWHLQGVFQGTTK
jgi:hypothetical protein